jgi:hypothetical protein
MKRFQRAQRIRVVNREPLNGKTGVVCRLLMRDDSAWVNMDEAIPEDVASFPEDDQRRNHVLLYPEDCEEIQ